MALAVQGFLELVECLVPREFPVFLDSLGPLVQPDQVVQLVFQDQLVLKVTLEMWDQWEQQDFLDQADLLVLLEHRDKLGQQERLVLLGPLVQPVQLAWQEPLGLLD